MKRKGKKSRLKYPIILFVVVIIIKLFSFSPSVIEEWYSTKLYPVIAAFLRFVTGWVPFSIGDIIYAFAGIWSIVRIYKSVRALLKRKITKETFIQSFRRTVIIMLWIYILFNFLWAMNYERLGIAYQLKLEPAAYSTTELKTLTSNLIDKVNTERLHLGVSSFKYSGSNEIFKEAKEAYDSAEKKYPFLHYSVMSVKNSMYGQLGNYLGFLGYYNPFTGEAQVNTTVPAFIIPYTACHEIGHQLGYGTEDEANFSGYLAAKSSKENTFHYSVYFDLFLYANRELYSRDSVAAKQNYKLLDTLVRKDIITYRKFLEAYRNPVEPYITMLYGKYLKANNQPNGMETYDEVIGWLIAYQKKYGEL